MPGRPQDVFVLFDWTKKEATYGAGVTLGTTTWQKYTGPGIVHHTKAEDVDQDEIKGHPFVSDGGGVVIEDRTRGSLEFKAATDPLVFFFGILFGNIAKAGIADPFTYTVKWPGSGVASPFSTMMVQATDRGDAANTQKKYNGIFANTVELTLENPGPAIVRVDLLGDGSDAADVTTVPAVDAATRGDGLRYEHLTLKFGPASEAITTKFRRLTLRANADTQLIPLPGSTTKVGEIKYGVNAPTLDGELVVSGQRGDTLYNYWANRTKVVFDMLLSIGANDQLGIICKSTRVPGDAGEIEGFDGIDHTLTLPLRFEYNATDASPFILTAKTGTNSILGT